MRPTVTLFALASMLLTPSAFAKAPGKVSLKPKTTVVGLFSGEAITPALDVELAVTGAKPQRITLDVTLRCPRSGCSDVVGIVARDASGNETEVARLHPPRTGGRVRVDVTPRIAALANATHVGARAKAAKNRWSIDAKLVLETPVSAQLASR